MPGRASGMSTWRMTCQRDAPIIATASILPAGISRRFSSNSRAAKGTAAMTSASIAALGPVERPSSSWLSGISAMMRMKKGNERSTLTTKPTTRFTPRTTGCEELSVSNSATPSGSPSTTVSSMVPAVMYRVTRIDHQRLPVPVHSVKARFWSHSSRIAIMRPPPSRRCRPR